MSNHRRLWLVPFAGILFLSIGLLSACSPSSTSAAGSIKLAPLSQLPPEAQKAAASVREAYQFAVANPDALKNVPCYCGCGAAGHTSDYSCYIKEVKSSGEILFDQHAIGCSICVDIAQDVMRMTKDGKQPGEIRAAIDQTYSRYGPSNMPDTQ